jgi:propanol-preferring alcohol dehydrogenase
VIVFARSREEQEFALGLGAIWAGDVTGTPPQRADAVIDTTPVWRTIVASLRHLNPGGRLVINAIRKEEGDKKALLDLKYEDHVWMEKEIKSVANITRKDVEEFLELAARIPIRPEVEIYPFEKANDALMDLKHKHVKGAKVLKM